MSGMGPLQSPLQLRPPRPASMPVDGALAHAALAWAQAPASEFRGGYLTSTHYVRTHIPGHHGFTCLLTHNASMATAAVASSTIEAPLQVVSGIRTCFCMYSFLDDHNFINNRPPDLKLVSNDAPCDLLLFLVVLYYTSGWGPDLFETCHSILKAVHVALV